MFPAISGIQVQGRRSRHGGINRRNTYRILSPAKGGMGLTTGTLVKP